MHSDSVFVMPRVAIYCRVSTREQLAGWSIETQIDACKQFCDKKYGLGCYSFEVFLEEGESGRKGLWEPGAKKRSYRPALSEMIGRIDRGDFDVLVVSQMNRISRTSRLWHELVDKYINANKIEFFSTKEDSDTRSPGGRLLATMLMGVAQYQAEEGAERVKMAHSQRTKDGYPLGSRPYGWRQTPADPENRVRPASVVVPEEAKWVRWMVEKYLQGWGFRAIAAELTRLEIPAPAGGKYWHTSVINKIIFTPFHYGYVEHQGEPIQGVHFDDRLFDPDVYDRLLKEKESRRKFPTVTASCSEAILAGMISCSSCGERLYVVHPRGKYRGYRCRSTRPEAPPCSTKPYVRGEFLEPKVIAEIRRLAESAEVQELALAEARRLMQGASTLHEDELEALERELAEIARKQHKWSDLFLDDSMPREMLQAKAQELVEQKARCEARIAEIGRDRAESRNLDDKCQEIQQILSDFPRLWEAMNFDEKRTILNLLLEGLSVSQENGRIQVHLKIALLPEIEFELPVVSSWARRGGEARRPKLTLRQLGLMDELAKGHGLSDIQVKWRVSRNNLLTNRRQAMKALNAKTIEEAIEKARPILEEWRPYLRNHGRYGGTADAPSVPAKLTSRELQVLKLVAAGWSEKAIAEHLDVPETTATGIRARLRDKLLVHSSEEAVARAVKAGLIGPDEPSPALLLQVYQEILDGKHDKLTRRGIVKVPSELQMAVLRDLTDGVQLQETASRRGTSSTAMATARKRMWAVVGGSDQRSALERVFELRMVASAGQTPAGGGDEKAERQD